MDHSYADSLPADSLEYKLIYEMFARTIGANASVLQIERLYNPNVQERFRMEVKISAKKYPTKTPSDLIKFLFHGARDTNSDLIYMSDEGLDMRYSRAGYYGNGIYFADNAKYSHTYARNLGDKFQMFVVAVLVGNAIRLQ